MFSFRESGKCLTEDMPVQVVRSFKTCSRQTSIMHARTVVSSFCGALLWLVKHPPLCW